MPEIDVFVAGIGTGGTICGVGKYLKQQKPSCEVVAVDPVGSIVYEHYKFGKVQTKPKTYKIEGIGEDFIPKNYDYSVITDMIQVEDRESFLMTRALLTQEGLYSGVSSGSAVVGALKWIKEQGERMRGKNVLVVLPDSGNRYLSKVYDDDWMREAGFLESQRLGTVADLLKQSPDKPTILLTARQSDRITDVVDLLRKKGISQVPVVDAGGWIKGLATEASLLSALYEGRAKATDSVEALVDSSIEFVTPFDTIEKVSKLVASGRTPLVTDPQQSGKPIGILTKIDILGFLGSRT